MFKKIIYEIKNKISDTKIEILSNNSKYFNAIVVSDFFKKKNILERQKILYNIISKYILNKNIHAVSFKIYTKDEWIQINK